MLDTRDRWSTSSGTDRKAESIENYRLSFPNYQQHGGCYYRRRAWACKQVKKDFSCSPWRHEQRVSSKCLYVLPSVLSFCVCFREWEWPWASGFRSKLQGSLSILHSLFLEFLWISLKAYMFSDRKVFSITSDRMSVVYPLGMGVCQNLSSTMPWKKKCPTRECFQVLGLMTATSAMACLLASLMDLAVESLKVVTVLSCRDVT